MLVCHKAEVTGWLLAATEFGGAAACTDFMVDVPTSALLPLLQSFDTAYLQLYGGTPQRFPLQYRQVSLIERLQQTCCMHVAFAGLTHLIVLRCCLVSCHPDLLMRRCIVAEGAKHVDFEQVQGKALQFDCAGGGTASENF